MDWAFIGYAFFVIVVAIIFYKVMEANYRKREKAILTQVMLQESTARIAVGEM